MYGHGIPPDDLERLSLFELDCDRDIPALDWSPVQTACQRWAASFASRSTPTLIYADGGQFLNIRDERFGDLRTGTLDGLERDLYLECLEIRSLRDLCQRFSPADQVRSALDKLVDWNIMFREAEQYLSLAVATAPHLAAARIRARPAQRRALRVAAS
jgi:hypothetical protein